MLEQLLEAELSLTVVACLDVETLLALEIASKTTLSVLTDAVEQRCKSECFSCYLHATMASQRMAAAAPKSWKLLYLQFSRLREMQWTECKSEGTSSSLRLLKTDNQEYAADVESGYLLRSGGHYWFSVLQTPLADASLSNPQAANEDLTQQINQLEGTEKRKALDFLRSQTSVNVGKWEKLRATGTAPCPRRHHTMTCLPTVTCAASVFERRNADAGPSSEILTRRVLFFGGQAEGMPYEAFNDLHLLLIDATHKPASLARTLCQWISPQASGGSDGTTPLPTLEVFLLHIKQDGDYGKFRWSTPRSTQCPSGRAMHSVCRLAEDEVLVFGGRQIGRSNNLLDVFRLRLHNRAEESWIADWSEPNLSGFMPRHRRGHSTCVIGEKMLLIGGQDTATGKLDCDVHVLDVRALEWRLPKLLPGPAPCPRRGFKVQYFGTSLVISSGFVMDLKTSRIDKQLPDFDIHVLTPR